VKRLITFNLIAVCFLLGMASSDRKTIKDHVIATIKDNGCTTSQQEAAQGKTRIETYNYAMLRGK